MPVIRVDQAVYDRLKAVATPFRRSERGTPQKVVEWLLDEHDAVRAALDALANDTSAEAGSRFVARVALALNGGSGELAGGH